MLLTSVVAEDILDVDVEEEDTDVIDRGEVRSPTVSEFFMLKTEGNSSTCMCMLILHYTHTLKHLKLLLSSL